MSESVIVNSETDGESREARLWPWLALLWVLACGVTQVSLPFYEPALLSLGGWMSSVWIGTMWAGWAAGVWASSVWDASRLSRVLFLVLIGSWHFLWMSATSGEPPTRYAMMLGGYGLAQAILFRMLSIPRWGVGITTGRSEALPDRDFLVGGGGGASEDFDDPQIETQFTSGRPQFGIAELIGITTVVALLITVGKAYRPFLGNSFWWGLLVAEAMLLAIATLSVRAGLSRQSTARWCWLLATVVVCGGAAAVIAYGEEIVAGQSAGVLTENLFTRYLVLLLVFALWILAFANLSMLPVRIERAPSVASTFASMGDLREKRPGGAEPSGRESD